MMKHTFLLVSLIVAFIACSAGTLWALPIQNDNGTDGFEDVGGTPYAYYVNSGKLMFIAEGNNLGNPANRLAVQTQVKDWLMGKGILGSSDPFTLVNNTSAVTVYGYDGSGLHPIANPESIAGAYASGAYEVDTSVFSSGIEFYAIKASTYYAFYYEHPAEVNGSWSTYDLWLEKGRGEILEVSHWTGYNGSSAPVPEPATMILLGTGLIGLAGLGRKRLRKV
jgi:hypothetical protein